MRIMLDTNILISAFVFGGKTRKILECLFENKHEILVSQYVDSEFKTKLKQKWPNKAKIVYMLYHKLPFNFCESTDQVLGQVRDKKDIPVFSDALFNNVDVLLTGDKDFLESNIIKPIILSPNMMLEFLESM